jgi:hypothetical protein
MQSVPIWIDLFGKKGAAMKSTAVWALGALNILLLVLLVARTTGGGVAMAQAARPGDYLMIPGQVIGGNNAVVYVLDQTSRQLTAMSYDDSMKRMDTMVPINVDRALGGPAGRRPNR